MIFISILEILVYTITIYYFILGLFGLKRKDNYIESEEKRKFALVIAAHNEELVIEKLIKSLINQSYPKEFFDIFVVADNCSDNTANIANSLGVNVYERFDNERIGKGYALEWIFERIYKENKYDTIAIFDADNLVHKNWITEINNKMQQGYRVVQGYIDSKNPSDTWIAASYSIAFWTQNRLYQLARTNLKLSSQIGGTGFAMDISLLKKVGWEPQCLTEDLEFSCKVILNEEKIGWAHNAIIYDEKPLTLKASWKQRKRWMQGFSDVASKYFFKLLEEGLKKRKWFLIDAALYVVQPYITLLIGITLLLNIIPRFTEFGVNIYSINYLLGSFIIGVVSFSQLLVVPLVLKIDNNISKGMLTIMIMYIISIFIIPQVIEGREGLFRLGLLYIFDYLFFIVLTYIALGKEELKLFLRFLLYGVYNITWIPISIQGIVNKNNKEWYHTKHIRNVELQDIK